MNDRWPHSSAVTAAAVPPAVAPDALLARILLGMLCVAAVAVLSLPQARAASAAFGWTPLWLLATPLSGWLALQARRHALRAVAAPMRRRRRVASAAPRRRTAALPRNPRHAWAARAG